MNNKKLRLAVTYKCPKKCAMCCNKSIGRPQGITLQEIIKSDYEEVSITGGEPMLALDKTLKVAQWAKRSGKRVYLYTASYPILPLKSCFLLSSLFRELDGLTYTMHEPEDEENFKKFTADLYHYGYRSDIERVNFRLKQFDHFMMKSIPPKAWNFEFTQWIENCPLPEDEDYRRLIV